MAAMGRKRQGNFGLPPRMHLKGGCYYYVTSSTPRKWIKLHAELAKARIMWTQLENGGLTDTGLFNTRLDEYLVSPKFLALSAGTRTQYESVANRLRVCFDKVLLGDINPTHIAAWMDEHPSAVQANTGKAVISNVFAKAVRVGEVDRNPCKEIVAHRIQGRDRYITDAEYQSIWAKADPHVQIAMDIGYLTGARIQAILDIKLQDIVAEGVFIAKDKAKGATRKRMLFLTSAALEEVLTRARRLLRSVRGMNLICTHNGGEYLYDSFNRHWLAAVALSGVNPDTHFHDIRAKAATDAKAQGMDYQSLLGHASKAMSDKYIKLREVERVAVLPMMKAGGN